MNKAELVDLLVEKTGFKQYQSRYRRKTRFP